MDTALYFIVTSLRTWPFYLIQANFQQVPVVFTLR